jgi:ribosomal protein S18 acetylase RimI-like enzyme
MGMYDDHYAKSVFGHGYVNYLDNRSFIVARNALGPVGIISLFDCGAPDSHRLRPDVLSISFISVSPGYRRLGIGTKLIRQAMQYCIDHKKILSRTSPSSM